MKILAIIPARGGSKGIPNKNILEIKELPLIAHTIIPSLTLVKEGLISKLIVSTDSSEIGQIAEKYGAEFPFIRPEEISGDKAKSIDLIKHAIEFYKDKGEYYDAVLLLQPTSPLRTSDDIRNAIILFCENNNDSLISAYEEEYINDLVMYKKATDGNTSVPLNSNHNKGIRRQDHGATFVRNGCIYITRLDLLEKDLIIGETPLLYIMPKSKSINLDTIEDVEILKRVL
jgi:CMP-N,N'-diacetyllegionaminic acid synthase